MSKSAIKELEQAIASLPEERRLRILDRLVDIFEPLAPRLSDLHVDVFDQVIGSLIADANAGALAELSSRLAVLPRAPHRTVLALACNPDYSVAGALLTGAECLTQEDLAEIAGRVGNRHLLAMSGRDRLEPPVTEVLVRRADTETMRVLAANAGALFSAAGFTLLMERAADDAMTAEKIIQRADVTPELLQVMIARASEFVRARLVGAAPPMRRAAVQSMVTRAAEPPAEEAADDNAAYYTHTIARLKEDRGEVTEKDLLSIALAKKTGEATAALSMLCGIAPATIEELMDQARLEPFLMMCKAANFRWSTVRSLLEMRPRPGKSMQDFLTEACEDFNRLSPHVSQQALKFWQTKRAAAG